MFDFRYHVASLAAVFLALVVGIVIGVGLSGQGVVRESERFRLNEQLDLRQAQLDAARSRLQQQEAAERFVEAAYPTVMARRLAGKRIVVVFVGRADESRSAITQAIQDAGGTLARLRVVKVPVDEAALGRTIDASSELAALVSQGDVRDIGRVLARELLAGGPTPLWDALAGHLLIERDTVSDVPADGVVVVRTAELQQGPTARFLNGLYTGLTGSVPAVWCDTGATGGSGEEDEGPAHPPGFAAVRDVGTALGSVALAVLLETGLAGDYGAGGDAVVPPISPVEPPTDESG
jgi:hypothetical protein